MVLVAQHCIDWTQRCGGGQGGEDKIEDFENELVSGFLNFQSISIKHFVDTESFF